jgi:hypothetical protein
MMGKSKRIQVGQGVVCQERRHQRPGGCARGACLVRVTCGLWWACRCILYSVRLDLPHGGRLRCGVDHWLRSGAGHWRPTSSSAARMGSDARGAGRTMVVGHPGRGAPGLGRWRWPPRRRTSSGSLWAGLRLFGFAFAVNSSVHSYLVLAYAGSEKAAEDVGFYYAANALGRFLRNAAIGLAVPVGRPPVCAAGVCGHARHLLARDAETAFEEGRCGDPLRALGAGDGARGC